MNADLTLGDLFTDKQLRQAADIIANSTTGTERHQQLREKIVEPNMGNIDKVTGQQNSASCMAHLLEYALTRGDML